MLDQPTVLRFNYIMIYEVVFGIFFLLQHHSLAGSDAWILDAIISTDVMRALFSRALNITCTVDFCLHVVVTPDGFAAG